MLFKWGNITIKQYFKSINSQIYKIKIIIDKEIK